MYCNMYPHMREDTFITFEEWYDSCKRHETPTEQSTEEILADVNNIISMTLGGNDGVTV